MPRGCGFDEVGLRRGGVPALLALKAAIGALVLRVCCPHAPVAVRAITRVAEARLGAHVAGGDMAWGGIAGGDMAGGDVMRQITHPTPTPTAWWAKQEGTGDLACQAWQERYHAWLCVSSAARVAHVPLAHVAR